MHAQSYNFCFFFLFVFALRDFNDNLKPTNKNTNNKNNNSSNKKSTVLSTVCSISAYLITNIPTVALPPFTRMCASCICKQLAYYIGTYVHMYECMDKCKTTHFCYIHPRISVDYFHLSNAKYWLSATDDFLLLTLYLLFSFCWLVGVNWYM